MALIMTLQDELGCITVIFPFQNVIKITFSAHKTEIRIYYSLILSLSPHFFSVFLIWDMNGMGLALTPGIGKGPVGVSTPLLWGVRGMFLSPGENVGQESLPLLSPSHYK